MSRVKVLGRCLGAMACSAVLTCVVSPAGATLVTIDGQNGSETILLEGGDYVATVTGGGWNAWGGRVGFAPEIGEVVGWLNGWDAVSSDGDRFGGGDGGRYTTPSQAVAAAPQTVFTLDGANNVNFHISDPFPSDNVGYLSISVERISENPLENVNEDKLSRLFEALQSVDPGTVADLVKNWQQSGDLVELFGNLGRQLRGTFGSALSRVGGVINNLLTGLLDPEVAQGVGGIAEAIAERDNELGVILNRNERRYLQELFREQERWEGHRNPIDPQLVGGNRTTFEKEVNGGVPILLDPELAYGFEYSAGDGGPLFISFILPYLGEIQEDLLVEVWDGRQWTFFANAAPLTEYFFDSPVQRFRVTGINPELGIGVLDHTGWVSAVSFDRDGIFRGSITALKANAVPEPSILLMLGVGLCGLLLIGIRGRQNC